jgi:hypothetical protein
MFFVSVPHRKVFHCNSFKTFSTLCPSWGYAVLVIVTDILYLGGKISRTGGQEARSDGDA